MSKSRSRSVVFGLVLTTLACVAFAAEEQPWQKLYTGAEATGENVIALWQFQPGQETKDASGHGHDLKLRGQARFLAEGPLGGCLESFLAGTGNDKAQGVEVKNKPELTPAGAFTLELWVKGKPELDQAPSVFVVDKKYINYFRDAANANWDYCLLLLRAGEGRKRMQVGLGYGTSSETYNSADFPLPVGEWVHLAFTYDGAGVVRFFVNGRPAGKAVHEGRGPITHGNYDLVIGDRFGSVHSGFPGYIAQVRLSNGIVPAFTGLGLDAGLGRTVFRRMEKNASLSLTVSNDTGAPLTGGSLRVVFGGATRTIPIPDLKPNQEHAVPVLVDTTLRPDTYPLAATVSAKAGERVYRSEKQIPVIIVPRPLPNQMPVVMWGHGDLPRLKEIGFTHDLMSLYSPDKIWAAGQPTDAMDRATAATVARTLDDYLANGIGAVGQIYPGTWVMRDEKRKAQFARVDRAGKARDSDNVCANFPEVRRFAYNVGASVAKTFGGFPALQGALIHSEVRDSSDLCFHPHDLEACRAATGADVPAEVASKGGVRYTTIKGFPPQHVVPDNHPILAFYRWFWKEGDGWNRLHTEASKGLKSTGRSDLWTFFDPAVRVPSVWGSGGEVDVISQWTYSYPDPIKIGQATDELFAMAEGRPGQQVMKMTQVIWYRTQTAPKPKEGEPKRPGWETEKPDADFPTIAPDHMREAFWSKISRPIRGIMYHGWQSLVETGATKGYCFTNPETQGVLKELTHTVVRPLGPTLLQVPDRPSDVGILESFSSQVFAGRGTYGWSASWEADMHLILQWAQIQPRILYEETIQTRPNVLNDMRVLVMPFCDVLTETVARKVIEFQKRGGIIVADEYLAPAITPDILVPSYKRTRRAREDKAALQALAAQLRKELDSFYTRHGESDNPDVVVRFRQYRDTDYLFALNDKRTFGDYVGHHGLVMEKGLPNSATITVRRPRGYVYDLVAHKAVPAKVSGGALRIPATFGPGGGHLFLIAPAPVAGVKVVAPAKAQLGEPVEIRAAVLDDKGAPLAAVLPVQVDVLDPQGRPAERSGYYGAKDGRLVLTLDLAKNDLPGRWTVKVRELASGKAQTATFTAGR